MITTPADVSWDIVATAMAAGGWSCFCSPEQAAGVATKAHKIARRLRMRVHAIYEDGRFYALPRIEGRCCKPRGGARREADDLAIVAQLQDTVRRLMAAHAAGGTLRA